MTNINADCLKNYWVRNYPCEALVEMLTRNGDPLEHFEFAFECQCHCQSMANNNKSGSGDTFMQRYQSFESAADLRGALKARSEHSKVLKLHIGACWNGVPIKMVKVDNPKEHDLGRLRPYRAPLRIDIDLTDYTPDLTSYVPIGIRKDDLEANDLHWPILDLAIRITKRCLKDCFGMDEVLCFYSGRRGVHIWVLDERAWQMDDEARAVVIDFLSCPLDKRGVASDSFLDRTPLYSELFDEEILPSFFDMLENSEINLFTTASARCQFQAMMNITHPEITLVFRELNMSDMRGMPPAHVKFATLVKAINEKSDSHPTSCGWMRKRLHVAVLTLMWPRFDKGASAKLNHLIKAPFSVHSNTRRIAVPLRDDLTNFWPGNVPRVGCEEHEIHSAEGDLRDELASLGTPKPWVDPAEALYLSWTPPEIDPMLEQIRRYEEEDRRAKRRKLGIDDEVDISSLEYVASRNMWGIRVARAFDICVSETHLHMRTQLCKQKGGRSTPLKVAVGGRFHWKRTIPVKEVWKAIEPRLSTVTKRWKPVLEDGMFILFEADENFSNETQQRATERMNAIMNRSQDEDVGHVSVRRHDSKYMMWDAAFPEVVRLWPIMGVVEL